MSASDDYIYEDQGDTGDTDKPTKITMTYVCGGNATAHILTNQINLQIFPFLAECHSETELSPK